MNKITVVEDDAYLREELVNTLTEAGYAVSSISSFLAPEQEILSYKPDLVLLDLSLPRDSGFALCKFLKSKASFPILILTARDTLSDELKALNLGADDFLTKPCHPLRLLARIKLLLRAYTKVHSVIQAKDLMLDTDTYKVIWNGSHTILSDTEGRILRLLIEAYPNVASKDSISSTLWGGDTYVDENILQVNITRLRKSMGTLGLRDIVKTARGFGYRLEV